MLRNVLNLNFLLILNILQEKKVLEIFSGKKFKAHISLICFDKSANKKQSNNKQA